MTELLMEESYDNANYQQLSTIHLGKSLKGPTEIGLLTTNTSLGFYNSGNPIMYLFLTKVTL